MDFSCERAVSYRMPSAAAATPAPYANVPTEDQIADALALTTPNWANSVALTLIYGENCSDKPLSSETIKVMRAAEKRDPIGVANARVVAMRPANEVVARLGARLGWQVLCGISVKEGIIGMDANVAKLVRQIKDVRGGI
jgi:hypothetical protein